VANAKLVAEAAVVGRPDDLTGEAVCAFVVLKGPRPSGDEAKKIANELRDWVAKEIGPIAKPKEIRFGENLPKTRSGKIMRRLLRSVARGDEITQDVSTLENPGILDQLRGVDPGSTAKLPTLPAKKKVAAKKSPGAAAAAKKRVKASKASKPSAPAAAARKAAKASKSSKPSAPATAARKAVAKTAKGGKSSRPSAPAAAAKKATKASKS